MTPEKIAKDIVVAMHYRLKLDDGSLVEESFGSEPLVYLHGHSNIIPGLENALEGLGVGEAKNIVVEAADAYGEHDPDGREEVKRSDLPPELVPTVGLELGVRDEQGNEYIARVIEVKDETIVLDFNHPMAGERLHFEVEVTDLRAATQEEISHGHAHGAHGHHH